MYGYDKLITSNVSVNFTRMLIGASSTVYMIVSGIDLYQVGIIKSFQAIIIVLLGLIVGVVSDRINRKILYVIGVFLASIWLFTTYIAGSSGSFTLFLIAELFNALSLCIFQNNNYAYLVDSYNSETDDNNIKKLFGRLSHLDFLFMAIASLLGGFIYAYLNGNLFLISAFIMFLIFILSFIYLPNYKVTSSSANEEITSSSKFIDKNDFILILEKMKSYKKSLVLFLFLGLYFQIIIQYWQVLVYKFDLVKSNEFLLGIILFFMLIVQSWSGKAVQETKQLNHTVVLILFGIGLILSLIGMQFSDLPGLFIFISGICLNLFSIRYVIIVTDSNIHASIPDFVRAKFDMILNTSLRLITALGLLLVGFMSENYDINLIIYLGLVISCICLFINSIVQDKAEENIEDV